MTKKQIVVAEFRRLADKLNWRTWDNLTEERYLLLAAALRECQRNLVPKVMSRQTFANYATYLRRIILFGAKAKDGKKSFAKLVQERVNEGEPPHQSDT